MSNKAKPLSSTQHALLMVAVARDDHLVPPPKLPAGAARQVIRSMVNAALVEEVPAPIEDAAYAWRTGDSGGMLVLRATELGLARLREAGDVEGRGRGRRSPYRPWET